MKIAYLIGNFPVLSETFISNEVIRLQELGIDIQVYSFKKPPEQDVSKFSKKTQALIERTTYISHRRSLLIAMSRPVRLIKGIVENKKLQSNVNGKPNSFIRLCRSVALSKLIEDDRCDWLHAHWPYATQVAHLTHVITGIRYSVSIHAHEVAHENKHFPLVFKTLEFAAFCNGGAMGYLKELLNYNYIDKINLIYHGVDVDNFPALPINKNRKHIQIITAGRLTPTKGFDRLITACASARAAGIDVRLAILGRGQLESDLKDLALSLGFSDYLELPGWIPQQEVKSYMRDADIFALLADTGFHDGLPNVALEAMSCCKPVILSPLPSVSELVSHEVEGFVLQTINDYDGFIDALKYIQADTSRLEEMSLAARKRVMKDHNADKQIIEMKSLFEKVYSIN